VIKDFETHDVASARRLRPVGRPRVGDLPAPPPGRTGWPWTEGSEVRPWIEADHLPSISIVTPSFNQGQFIEETLRSVILQDYPYLELIVLDGGSTDETVSIIEKYQDWISVWRSEPDGGQTAAIAEGIGSSSGQLVNWLNSDDSLLPGALHALAEMHRLNPDANVFTGVRLQTTTDGFGFYAQNTWSDEWHNYLASRADFPQEVTFFTRSAYDRVGGVDQNYSFMFDVVFFNKILRVTSKIVCTRMPLGRFRVYPEMKTLRPSEQKDKERATFFGNARHGTIHRRIHSVLTRTHLARPVYRFINKYVWKRSVCEVYFDVESRKWYALTVAS